MFEITKETFDAVNSEHCYEEKYKKAGLSDAAIYGYGVKYFNVFERDGKYFVDYKTYPSCD